MNRASLSFRLALAVLPVILGLSFVLAGSSYWIARRTLLAELDKGVSAVSEAHGARVKAYFDQRKVEIATITGSPLFSDYHKNVDYGLKQEAEVYRREIERMLREFSGRSGAYARIRYIEQPSGRQLCRVGADDGDDKIADRQLRAALGKRGSIAQLGARRVPWHEALVVTYGTGIHGEDGRLLGLLAFDCSLAPVHRFLDGLRFGLSGRSYLAEGRQVVSRGGTERAGDEIVRWSDIPGTPWSVLTVVSRDEFLDPLSAIGTTTLFIMLAGFLGTAVIIGRRLNILLRPIASLASAARVYASGDLWARVKPDGPREIAVLAESFNTMADRLQQRILELESLQGMNDAMLRKLGRSEIGRACLQAAVTGLGFDRGTLYWIDPERGDIAGECVYNTESVGFTNESIQKRRIPIDSNDILAHVARTGEAVSVADPSRDPRVNPQFVAEVQTTGFCLAPIKGRERVLGIIGVDNSRSGAAMSEERLNSLTLFCGAAGLALENARSEERYRSSVENSPEAVVSLDAGLRVVLWNPRAEELFGWLAHEAHGRTLDLILDKRDYEKLKRGNVRQAEAHGRTRDGRRLHLSVSWTVEGSESFVVIQDLTEKKRLEAQLIQAEKMSAVGSLIAGVAHELNNPLQGVTGYAELAAESAGTPEHQSDLRVLHESAMRCRDIVRDLLRFVRQELRSPERVSLNEVARDTVRLMEYRITRRDGISLEVELDPREPEVAGEFAKLQQVAVNLISNACDAMEGKVGVKLLRVRTELAEGGRCRLTVDDNGPGVAPEDRLRIFDPFYTTKPVGHGTGLGLPVSAQIVAEHGGRLVCEESPDGGARFLMCLPICPSDVVRRAPSAQAMPEAVPGKRVLVVDDEPDLLRLMLRLLSEDGLVAVPARNVAQALELLEKESFDLVITDVEMGDRKGLELRSHAPRILFVTGDVLNPELYRELSAFTAPVLNKPFLRTEFLRAVRRILARRLS